MRRTLFAVAALSVFFTVGCTKTWVEDAGNYKRVFGYEKPASVQVVHSYYREQTNLFGSTYKYHFIEFRDEKFDPTKLHSVKLEVPDARSRYGCDQNPPSWFLSKSPEHYEMWVSTIWSGVRVFRDKDDGVIYSCAGKGNS